MNCLNNQNQHHFSPPGVTPTINLTLGSSAPPVPEGRKTEPVNLPQPQTSSSSYPRYMPLENSVSGSTTDTLLLSADTTPPPAPAPAYNSMYYANQWRQQRQQQLAPHQGYNPTVERNTHRSSSDDDVAVHGNSLAPAATPPLTAALLDALADSLHTPLVPAANLLSPAPNASIVSSEPLSVRPRPKQPNLPVSSPTVVVPSPCNKSKSSFFSRLRRPKTERSSGSSSSGGVTLPFFHRNSASTSSGGDGIAEPASLDNLVEIRPASSGAAQRMAKMEPHATEVRLVRGAPVVQTASVQDDLTVRRPNSLGINGHKYSSAPTAASYDAGGGANNVNVKCNLQRAAAVAAAAAAAAAAERHQPVSSGGSSQSVSSEDMSQPTISLQQFCEEGVGLGGSAVHQC